MEPALVLIMLLCDFTIMPDDIYSHFERLK